MPELPEVEVVRRGLERFVVGRQVADVEVGHPRAIRRHAGGPIDFADQVRGTTIAAAYRRGKYLHLPMIIGTFHGNSVESADDHGKVAGALIVHLGMSGQLLIQPPEAPDEIHLRVRFRFADGGDELRFVDQRTFGGMSVSEITGEGLPDEIAHIATDPLDDAFDSAAFASAMRRRRTGIKRGLLDQSLISGVGNIYADEALWRARLHYARPTETLTSPVIDRLVTAIRDVMVEALAAGGTSFDALYVNVNGESGYFERGLAVYGRADEPCPRCGTPIRRDPFMNRSSYTCPRCQPRPRRARW